MDPFFFRDIMKIMHQSYPCQRPPIMAYLQSSAVSTIKLSGFSACPWVSAKIQVIVADPVITTSSVLIWVAFIYYHSYHSGHRDPACTAHCTDAACALWSLWLLGKSALSLNSALFALNSLALYSQFGTWVLLLVSICLASLVESSSFPSLCALCTIKIVVCHKRETHRIEEERPWAYCINWPQRPMNLRFSPDGCALGQTWLCVTNTTGWSYFLPHFFCPETLALIQRENSLRFFTCQKLQIVESLFGGGHPSN